jgi:type I restriction enzyme R subunit
LIHDTHRKVAQELIEIADIEDDLTLVFAQNIDHANVIAEDFREVLKNELNISEADEFVKTITSEDRHSEIALENFGDKRRLPKIAVTVDMVSTGVDVRPLKNLVFLRAVRSPILYNQMVGRGTRNTPDKEFFRIFDCIGVFDYHGDQMFSTDNVDVQYTDSETTSEPVDGEDPKEIPDEDIDRVIKQYRAYPLPDEFATAERFVAEASELIREREQDLREAVEQAKTMEEADEAIESILSSEWDYFTQDYLLEASSVDISSLFELASEVLRGQNTIKSNAERAQKVIEQKYDLSNEQSEWINLFAEQASVQKETITKRKLLEKPFSDRGGYDRARKLFQDPDVETIISEFNKHLLRLKYSGEANSDTKDESSGFA